MSLLSARIYKFLKARGAKFTTRTVDLDECRANTEFFFASRKTQEGDMVRLCYDGGRIAEKAKEVVKVLPDGRIAVATVEHVHFGRILSDKELSKSWVRSDECSNAPFTIVEADLPAVFAKLTPP